MKQGWEIKRLDDACKVEYGTRVVQKKDGGTVYPVYGGGGATFFMDTFNREDCLVVARFAMSAQCTRFVEGKFFLNDSGLTVRPKNDKELLPDFLNLQMFFLNDHIYSLARGTAQRNLDVPAFRNIQIAYPKSIQEQQRIVSILDEAFAAIDKAKANAEQNLKNAKELFESYLQGVFENKGDGWEEKKLGEVIEYDKNQNIHKGLPYVGLEHIESNSGRFIGSLEPQVVKSSTFYFNEQHVLYGRLRPYLNKVLLPDFEGHCSTEIFPIKVGKQIAREFLFYWLIAGSTVKKIDATWTGARMPRANMNQVLEFDFAFPTLEEQQTIVSQLDALRVETQKLEAVYQKKIADLEELKKSILQKAFAGELKVSEPLINAD